MADQIFQVVFRGQIAPDNRLEAVKANLARLFKTDAARIERLFTGQAVVLKKGLGREEGERYCALLHKAGALCELVATSMIPPPPPVAHQTRQQADVGPQKDAGGPAAPPVKNPAFPAEAPDMKQRTAAIKDKTGKVPAGDLQQALGAIKEKVREIDTEEAGRKVTSLVEGAAASFQPKRLKGRIALLKRNKLTWAVAGMALIVLVALLLTLGGSSKPMPIESDAFNRLVKQYHREIRKTDMGGAGTMTLVALAREVVEDMGYDFDRTLIFWLLHKDLVETKGGMDVYAAILVEPAAVAVAADLSGIGELIAPETQQVFKKVADLPQGVDLLPIRMVKACPATGALLKQADMLKVMEDNGVAINAAQPDLAIADTFFGLERAGLIKIHRRWDDDVQYSDIEILDRDTMNTLEGKLVYMEAMRKEFVGR